MSLYFQNWLPYALFPAHVYRIGLRQIKLYHSYDRSHPVVFNNIISDLFCHKHNATYNALIIIIIINTPKATFFGS
jgi:hypothetical protein